MQTPTFPAIVSIDALTCGVMGMMLIVTAQQASVLLSLPVGLLSMAGWLLLPVAILMAFAAARRMRTGPIPLLILIGNLAWVGASFAVLALGTPNAFGIVFVLAQALVVAVFAWLEWQAIRTDAPSSKSA